MDKTDRRGPTAVPNSRLSAACQNFFADERQHCALHRRKKREWRARPLSGGERRWAAARGREKGSLVRPRAAAMLRSGDDASRRVLRSRSSPTPGAMFAVVRGTEDSVHPVSVIETL
ncbi:hypothetical protein AAFF_G00106740 [Aldrovandia affinis]|uniref:Uncharacterized protein n=1 Tax=Aldrovandia affinis TaxID=143900 RepID=A0AAD7T3F8_9TELE|nr:hypothetical protein AAFF_G00106740 [Aldrovandia affinis]